MSHVLAIGVFDLFHVGHLRYLQFARAQGARLSVAVTSDATALQVKGALPVVGQEQRMEILRGLGWIDAVALLPTSTDQTMEAAAWMQAWGIERVVVGGEWAGSPRWVRLTVELALRGIEVVYAPHTQGISSTAMIEKAAAQYKSGSLGGRAFCAGQGGARTAGGGHGAERSAAQAPGACADREASPAHTWWLTGLPGAGKSTLANALAAALQARAQPGCVLDGDAIRRGLCQDLGFSPEARHENMRRVAHLARLLNDQGLHAIVALVSPTLEGRSLARHTIGTERFFEVHVATPLAVCQQRDPKGLYARAQTDAALGLTGVQAPYEAPASAELILDTSKIAVGDACAMLLGLLLN